MGSFAVPLAQHGGHGASSGEVVMTVLLVTVLVVIWTALGVVCWIFWRAKKREDVEKAKANANREATWSAPSS